MSKKEEIPGFREYVPVQNPQKVRNAFDFFISEDESIIYKRNNYSNEKFSELIKSQGSFNEFKKVLDGSFFSSCVSGHIPNGYDLESDGSHKMKFLHGCRLDLIESYDLDPISAKLILNQVINLLNCLAKANEEDDLFGDWATHNLVYSFELNSIFNIDLEGFMTYRPLPVWADYNAIERWLNSIIVELQALAFTTK